MRPNERDRSTNGKKEDAPEERLVVGGGRGGAGRANRPGPWPPKIDPFVPRTDHNPTELKSWAKRTGFNPNFSGENASTVSDESDSLILSPPRPPSTSHFQIDTTREINPARRRTGFLSSSSTSTAKTEIHPILGRRRDLEEEIGVEDKEDSGSVVVEDKTEDFLDRIRRFGRKDPSSVTAATNGIPKVTPVVSPQKKEEESGEEETKNVPRKDTVQIDMFSESDDPDYPFPNRPSSSGLSCELTENPGFREY